MKEKFELIIGLYKDHMDTMKPYEDLLGCGVEPISNAWYEDIYRVGEFIGVDRDWSDACFDLLWYGYCMFTLDNGEEYKAESIEDFVYAWEH